MAHQFRMKYVADGEPQERVAFWGMLLHDPSHTLPGSNN